MAHSGRASFGSKMGMILATAGSAVGLGNVWRFPYMTGQNGGAAFIIIYIGCVLILGIPCMVGEMMIGRRGAANTARAYSNLSKGTPWALVGMLAVLSGFFITGYYAVVSGWCLEYLFGAATGNMNGDTAYFNQYFSDFTSNSWKPVMWMAIFLVITHFVIVRGVKNGIEKASKLLMPTLFILLLIIVVASCLLPNAGKGLQFLFHPDFSKVDANVFLSALGQAFYSLSLAMGCVCTYASYFNRKANLVNSALQISVIDCVVAILAGMVIFPAAFSVGVDPDSGASLIFITLPNVFEQAFSFMPTLGFIVSIMFYALLALAALTSLISLHEVSTAFVHEELHLSRPTAAAIVTGACAVMGTLCALSMGQFKELSLFGMSLFSLFDFVTGQIMLPLGGFFTCIFVGWYLPKKMLWSEFTNDGTLKGRFFAIFLFLMRFVCPAGILLIFLHQLIG